MTETEILIAIDRFDERCSDPGNACAIRIIDQGGTPIYQARVTGYGTFSNGPVEAYTDFNGMVDLYAMFSENGGTGASGPGGADDMINPRVPVIVSKPLFQNLEIDFLRLAPDHGNTFTLRAVYFDPLPPEGGDEGDGRPQDEQDAEGGYLPPDPSDTDGGADAGSGRSGLLWILLAIGGYLALRK